MTYLADTDWIIDGLANMPMAVNAFRAHTKDGISVSIVTFGELYEGAYGSANPPQRFAAIQQFLASYPVINLSDAIMHRFADLRYQLRRQGQRIPDLDLLIASTALEQSLTLMSRNLRHFGRIPGLILYQP